MDEFTETLRNGFLGGPRPVNHGLRKECENEKRTARSSLWIAKENEWRSNLGSPPQRPHHPEAESQSASLGQTVETVEVNQFQMYLGEAISTGNLWDDGNRNNHLAFFRNFMDRRISLGSRVDVSLVRFHGYPSRDEMSEWGWEQICPCIVSW
ncbi:MAG: hypothetical protein UT91_C0021G0011 [Parcubacteria group bacterium GW2011_GWA2_40_23]|nr:MAG: hypothetical protein UT91_C0021G0011 [Parcubacteria group bacterium GW2011_GWA2_40_23]